MSSLYAKHAKRWFDLLLSLFVLIVSSPILLIVALAIKLDSNGAVFYRQERIGRDGVPFRLFKFRSMVVGAEQKGAGILVERNDARITRVGRIIRKLSIDEIPQLFNVLRGEMSIVGPRPGLRYQVEQYDEHQRGRLSVRPGVTGWAQINGRNAIDWGRRIELDLEYVARISPWMDLRIILLTIPSVMKGESMIASRDYWKERAKSAASGASEKSADPSCPEDHQDIGR